MEDTSSAPGNDAPQTAPSLTAPASPAPVDTSAKAAAAAAAAATAASEDAFLNQFDDANAAPAAKPAAEAKPAAKPDADPAAADTADDTDPLEGITAPGVKSKTAAGTDPVAGRLATAAGRLALAEQGFTDDDIAGMSPERVQAIGSKRLAAQDAARGDDTATATPAAQAAPVAGLDAVLKELMVDEAEATKIKGVVSQAVQAQLADKIKGLEAAQAKAEAAADGMLQMRFNSAMRPLLSEFPALKDKAKLGEVLSAMDRLDPGQKIGTGADADAFNALLRSATFAVLGDGIAATARRGQVNAAKKQAAAVAEAPIGGASPASVGNSIADEEDRVLDALLSGRTGVAAAPVIPKPAT